VAAALDQQPRSRAVSLKILPDAPPSPHGPVADDDPFAGVEV
jgi:hypothetical protein